MAVLRTVRDLGMPDGWIAAGFVRNAVWDALHAIPPRLAFGDVDVIWFDPMGATPAADRRLEQALAHASPGLPWSVRNQARMHGRNGDAAYHSATHAMQAWPETATAVAARLIGNRLDVAAPCGLEDLFGLTLRPTPITALRRPELFARRMQEKRWLRDWPLLRVAGPVP